MRSGSRLQPGMSPDDTRRRKLSRATTATTARERSGLVLQGRYGAGEVVYSDQDMADDLLATIPKLHAALAAAEARRGSPWRRATRKGGVDSFELEPAANGRDDLDVAHGVLASTELSCHLNEVLNVLISHESSEYQATMGALCGDKFRDGAVLFQQQCQLSGDAAGRQTLAGYGPGMGGGVPPAQDDNTQQQVLLGVTMATLRPSLRLQLHAGRRHGAQRLLFSSVTHRYASKDRAVHVIKTLPKPILDQVVATDERSALRRELDHLAIGFDIHSEAQPGGASPRTRVTAHGYASVADPRHFRGPNARRGTYSPAELGKQRAAMMNPEAKHVLELLTNSLRGFERVIRRRRFGFQSFVYFPKESEVAADLKRCAICSKPFSLFRRDFFCQLCGHLACKDCSQLYEVEARVGEIRKNRACVQCVVRVDACRFEDEDLIAALGPVVVSDGPWFSDSVSDVDSETASLESDTSSTPSELRDQLYSSDPAQRSRALQELGRLVRTSSTSETSNPRSRHRKARPPPAKDFTDRVRWDIQHHLDQSLRVVEKQLQPHDYVVADLERDYAYEFDATRTRDPNHPLPPKPTDDREAARLHYIEQSGVLAPEYDRAALNLLAQVAAKQLNCPVGYVSMVDEDMFHAVGTFPERKAGNEAPRDENMCAHTIYADAPLVVKNPQRDMRFAQMPIIKDAGVKFYAGFPIRAPDGAVVATLCASDFRPHENITTKEYASMQVLADLAGQLVVPGGRQPQHRALAGY